MTLDPTLNLFAQSLLIGLSIAAPVGPIGLLTIQRTLARGPAAGLATGLGAAAADAVYGSTGAFGVTALIAWLTGAKSVLALAGGAFMLWMAWTTWRAPVAERAAEAGGGRDLLRCFSGTFVLTLSNPATILSFIAVFGALAGRLQPRSPWPMIAGVLVGSAAWWLFLSTAVGRLRERFDRRWRRRVNQLSALLLAAFALWQWVGMLPG
jgi:threonine/homoserine/homoserine lactone efflux protein